jgi:integrase
LSGSKVRNVIVAIRVVFRHAIERDEVSSNPTSGLRLPNGVGRRDRAASPGEAADLLAALPIEDRAVWATAFYAGLRRGELRALRWEDVDLASGVIRVHRSWDDKEGQIGPKSEKGKREVPLLALLRDHLDEAKTRTGRDGHAFVFGTKPDAPFTASHIRKRAARAWQAASEARADGGLSPLKPIGMHEARHTFVSMMAAAGLLLETIGDWVGHSTVYMTDRYRHVIEGQNAEHLRRADEYLARADTRGRIELLDDPEPA